MHREEVAARHWRSQEAHEHYLELMEQVAMCYRMHAEMAEKKVKPVLDKALRLRDAHTIPVIALHPKEDPDATPRERPKP